ncbi:hypothetical protein [Thiolapillus sp.]|uniref:hypothetical protein n=1 Tax=Thiolapillus sp. TaxID=2017437 RepID=UPI0025D92765|nr:hypothetical protein [Thiolapillus sp.]
MISIHQGHGYVRQSAVLMPSGFSRKRTLQRQQSQKQGKQNGNNFLLKDTHGFKR